MEILFQKIDNEVSKLSHEWFLEKMKLFEKEPFYVKSLEKVYEVIMDKDFFIDDDGEFFETEREIVVDRDLNNYCWNSFFYGSIKRESLSYPDESYKDIPIDAIVVSSSILELIKLETSQYTKIKAIHSLLIKTISHIKKYTTILTESKSDSLYAMAILHIREQFQIKLFKAFDYTQKQMDLLDASVDKLEFNLNQEQLAALLFILNKCGFFNTINFNDTSFLIFCRDYFYFKKGDNYKRPTSVKSFTDKYREFLRFENSPAAIEHVKKKLQDTLENL